MAFPRDHPRADSKATEVTNSTDMTEFEKSSVVDGGKPNGTDVEKSIVVPSQTDVKEKSLWDTATDNPKNWTRKKKWSATILVSMFSMMSLLTSTMIAPALPAMSADLGITSIPVTQVMLSAFILANSFGNLVAAPLSEVYGRKIVLQIGTLFYVIWNLVCGFSNHVALLIVARFMTGLGGSAAISVANGILHDCWRPEERGQSLAVATLLPLLGPGIGPIMGGYIVQGASWRWIFHVTSIASGVLQVYAIFGLPETYANKIQQKKAKKEHRAASQDPLNVTEQVPLSKVAANRLRTSLARPIRILFTHHTIQLIALYATFQFGMLYLVLATFSALWTTKYHQSASTSGLHYIAVLIGETAGSQIGAILTDKIWKRLKAKHNGQTEPEFRIPLMAPGVLLVCSGLLIYGWTGQMECFWLVPDIGVVLFTAGCQLNTQCIYAYIVDAHGQYTASASAAAMLLRSLAACGFPLFAPIMYQHLGYGWGNSVLALISLILGGGLPIMLWAFGPKLRAMLKEAEG